MHASEVRDTTHGVYVALSLALLTCLAALVVERRKGTIPNALSLGALLAGPALVLALDALVHGRPLVLASFGFVYFRAGLAALLASYVPYQLWRRNWLGGGAVKLVAGVAATTGDASLGLLMGLVWGLFGAYVWWTTRKPPARPATSVLGSAVTLGVFVVAASLALVRDAGWLSPS